MNHSFSSSQKSDNISPLDSTQVAQQIQLGNSNNFTLPSRSYWDIVRDNVFNNINIILFAIFFLLVSMGKYSDSFVYITVAIINSAVAVYQEISSKIKLDSISLLFKPKATVIRLDDQNNEHQIEINPTGIVLGDCIVLKQGDQILVDGIVLSGKIEVDESLLTGESDLVKKIVDSKVSSGSFVSSGQAIFQATQVGANSTANKLATEAKAFRKVSTQLQREIDFFVKLLIVIVGFFLILAFGKAFLANNTSFEILTMVAVIVGLVPHSLFMMMTLAYGLGAVRMLKKGALVQQLNAVESLSNIDVLCLDKTGTLTTNNIRLDQIIDLQPSPIVDLESILAQYARLVSVPNKTIEALQLKLELPQQNQFQVLGEVSFDSKRKWSGLSWEYDPDHKTFSDNSNAVRSIVIGAPEILFAIDPSLSNPELTTTINEHSSLGKRVLIVLEATSLDCQKMEIGNDLSVLGLVVMSDELRQEAGEIINHCYDLGVQVKIISGDNPRTVTALAKQVGVKSRGMISGVDLLKYSQEELKEKLPHIVQSNDIFGRVTPEQKKMLVQALRDCGMYVAMTGDGVNDIPALKTANLAISMESGSPATRNIADIVLLKDSFASMPIGFSEGKKIRFGMQGILALYFSRIIYTTVIICSIMILGIGFPLAIKHASLIGMFCAAIPTILLTLIAVPGYTPKKHLLRSQLSIVIPMAGFVSLFAIAIYTLAYSKFSADISNIHFSRNILMEIKNLNINTINGIIQDKIEFISRTFMLLFILFVGIWNVVIISPPKSTGDAEADKVSYLPAILAFILTLITILIFTNPTLAKFFDIYKLSLAQVILIFSNSIICNAVIYVAYKRNWFGNILSDN